MCSRRSIWGWGSWPWGPAAVVRTKLHHTRLPGSFPSKRDILESCWPWPKKTLTFSVEQVDLSATKADAVLYYPISGPQGDWTDTFVVTDARRAHCWFMSEVTLLGAFLQQRNRLTQDCPCLLQEQEGSWLQLSVNGRLTTRALCRCLWQVLIWSLPWPGYDNLIFLRIIFLISSPKHLLHASVHLRTCFPRSLNMTIAGIFGMPPVCYVLDTW